MLVFQNLFYDVALGIYFILNQQLSVKSSRPNKAHFPSYVTNLLHNLLLHEIQTHGQKRHSQKDVHRTYDELRSGLGFVLGFVHLVNVIVARNEIPEPDRHETREAEIRTVQVIPTLPIGENDRPQDNIEHEHKKAGCDGNRD